MEVQLTHELEAFIDRCVKGGRFSSADDAVREAVKLLEQREAQLQHIRAFAQAGLDDLEAGCYEDFSDENLQQLFEGVEMRGQLRLAAERRS